MPNHVTSRITAPDHVIARLTKKDDEGDLMVDFGMLIAPPDDPAYRDEPSQQEAKASPNWWYRWNVDHWGTKWNGYAAKIDACGRLLFKTAWGAPHPVVKRLAEVAGVPFKHEWADEDTGSNVGIREYASDGTYTETEMTGTRDGYDLAFDLRPEIREYYTLIDGRYESVEN